MPGPKQVSKITKQSHYNNDPDLYDKLLAKISIWSSSVLSGTYATLVEVMNFGGYPNIPVDVWLDPFENGIEGLSIHKVCGPLTELSSGLPYLVCKN